MQQIGFRVFSPAVFAETLTEIKRHDSGPKADLMQIL
jgi:hypothetical protein